MHLGVKQAMQEKMTEMQKCEYRNVNKFRIIVQYIQRKLYMEETIEKKNAQNIMKLVCIAPPESTLLIYTVVVGMTVE